MLGVGPFVLLSRIKKKDDWDEQLNRPSIFLNPQGKQHSNFYIYALST